MTRTPRPDFLIIGAPKAGTTALHAALAQHPQIFVTDPKEPKHYLCDRVPPPAFRGPGDAHSNLEWIWRPADYAALFAGARPDQLRGESTPFYLWSRTARRRIAEELPDAKLVVVLRDPVDRAYSNWMHLWSDGLEPNPDFVDAFRREQERVDAGWAPFWHYRSLGLYGEQLAALHDVVDPERVLVLRYRDIVERPAAAVDTVSRFLGVDEGHVPTIPRDNARPFVRPGLRTRVLGPVVRAGARAGANLPPHLWRAASKPLVGRLHGSGSQIRPPLAAEARAHLVGTFAEDIALLEQVTGRSYGDWLTGQGRGAYDQRAATA